LLYHDWRSLSTCLEWKQQDSIFEANTRYGAARVWRSHPERWKTRLSTTTLAATFASAEAAMTAAEAWIDAIERKGRSQGSPEEQP
jgi:hypothetical protein